MASSKDYFIGSDKDLSKIGLNNLLLYNKTGREMEISATDRKVTNVELLPPYEGLTNIKIFLPPYESVAIIGIRLTNQSLNFNYSFKLSLTPGKNKKEDSERWKRNNACKGR